MRASFLNSNGLSFMPGFTDRLYVGLNRGLVPIYGKLGICMGAAHSGNWAISIFLIGFRLGVVSVESWLLFHYWRWNASAHHLFERSKASAVRASLLAPSGSSRTFYPPLTACQVYGFGLARYHENR